MTKENEEFGLVGAAEKLMTALEIAEQMLCEQEDALRSLGAHEPNAEPAILTVRTALAFLQQGKA